MIETPEAPHAHKHSGIKWLDVAMAISVLVVSVGSLLVALHTSHAMQDLVEQNARLVRSNSTPVLQFGTGNVDGDGEAIYFDVTNSGTGPARIVWFELRENGQSLPDAATLLTRTASQLKSSPDGRAVLDRLKAKQQALRAGLQAGAEPTILEGFRLTTAPIVPLVLAPRDNVKLLRWARPKDADSFRVWLLLNEQRFNVTAETCYCSLLDECWQAKLGKELPRRVPQCDARGRVNYVG